MGVKKLFLHSSHFFLQCYSKCKQNGWRCYCLSAFRWWWWWFERLFISHKFFSRLFKLEYENACVIERKTKNLCSIEMYKCNSLKMVLFFFSAVSVDHHHRYFFCIIQRMKKILNKGSARENCIINSHAICNNAGGECLIFENKWI